MENGSFIDRLIDRHLEGQENRRIADRALGEPTERRWGTTVGDSVKLGCGAFIGCRCCWAWGYC